MAPRCARCPPRGRVSGFGRPGATDMPAPAPLSLPTMHSPLAGLLHGGPLVVSPLDGTVRAALEAMAHAEVDAVVVADPQTRYPLGIFTLHDLLRRVALAGAALDEPVLSLMTAGLVTLKASATA